MMKRRYCSVLRTTDESAVAAIAEAYTAGGMDVLEFTMTCPNRFEHIKDYARRGFLVGLGTCLTVDARAANARRGSGGGHASPLRTPAVEDLLDPLQIGNAPALVPGPLALGVWGFGAT